jgi:hypothetical protein
MSPLLLGAAFAAAICIASAAIVLWPRKPAPQPWQAPQPDPFDVERRALREAVERIAQTEGVPRHAVTLLEAKADRLAALVAAGTTTRGNAIHRITAQARKHARPNRAVEEFIARIQTPTNAEPN